MTTMSTRGFICFVNDGRQKTQYIPGGSDPDHMGLTVLRWLRRASVDIADLRQHVQALRLIEASTKPTAEDLERFGKYAMVANADDWHNLLYWTGTDPDDRGRFAHMKPVSEPGAKSFQPVALRVAWPLAALPDDPAFLTAARLTADEEAQSSHELAEFSGFYD
jgi:hypothetical protein